MAENRDTKKILVIQGPTAYHVLNRATDEMIEGFQSMGYEVQNMYLEAVTNVDCIKMLEAECDFIFSIEAIGFEAVLDGTPFLEMLNKPYFGYLADDPIYHYERMSYARYDNSILFFCDESFPAYANRMFPDLKHTYFLPGAGFDPLLPAECETDKGLAAHKDIDVLFSCSIHEPFDLKQNKDMLMPLEQFLIENTLEYLKTCPWLSVRQGIERVLNAAGVSLDNELLLALGRTITIIDSILRYNCKYQVLEKMLKAGMQVHVIGKGGEELVERYSDQVTVHGRLDIDQVVALMGRSKIVINPTPTLTCGIHERIATALLSHAVCFTPYSPWLEEKFKDALEYIDMRDLDKMILRMQDILQNESAYYPAVHNNYKMAAEKWTWKQRGVELVEFYERNWNGKAYE